jgi:hypothetical protein
MLILGCLKILLTLLSFKNFYSAFDKAFTEANARSEWLKTGIEPFDPDQVIKTFKGEGGDHPKA